eukprot:SM002678S09922  [mRNA]  locus=s2678:296:1682:- [translate_table: standard]
MDAAAVAAAAAAAGKAVRVFVAYGEAQDWLELGRERLDAMYVLDLRKAIIDALGLQLANPRTAKVYFEAPGSGGSSREQACLRGSELVGAAFRERSGGEWRDAYSVVLRGGDPVPVEVVLEGPPGMLLLEAAQDAASPLLSAAAAQQGMTTRAAARALLAIADTSSEGAAEVRIQQRQ